MEFSSGLSWQGFATMALVLAHPSEPKDFVSIGFTLAAKYWKKSC